MTQTRYRNPEEHFPNMMRLSEEIGCQLKPNTKNPAVLNGLCPFHEAETLREAKTLSIDTEMLRFWCSTCDASGNPLAFIARVWGTSARDTYHLIEHQISNKGEITSERPAYPAKHFQRPREKAPIPQNTALLTRASKYYGRKLLGNFEPLHFLVQLGIHPRQATKIGLGYSTGEGLKEYLSQHGFSEDEIDNSPLFYESSDLEALTERITIAERDYTNAAMWMTSIPPEGLNENHKWSDRKPKTYGIRETRPHLLNTVTLTRRNPNAVLTEDARLYIILAVNEIPCILIPQIDEDLSKNADLVLNELKSKNLENLSIAMHHREARRNIGTRIPEEIQNANIRYFSRNDIMETLDIQTRDVEKFRTFGAVRRSPNKQNRQRTSAAKNGTERKPTPKRNENEPQPDRSAGLQPTHQRSNLNGDGKPEASKPADNNPEDRSKEPVLSEAPVRESEIPTDGAQEYAIQQAGIQEAGLQEAKIPTAGHQILNESQTPNESPNETTRSRTNGVEASPEPEPEHHSEESQPESPETQDTEK